MEVTSNIFADSSEILDIERLRDILTIGNPAHATHMKYGGKYGKVPPENLHFLEEVTPGKYSIPRNIPSELLSGNISDKTIKGTPIKDKSFTGQLRDYQEEYLDNITKEGKDDICNWQK